MPQGSHSLPASLDCAEILDQLSVALALVDEANGRFAKVNRAFTASFGEPAGTFQEWWEIGRAHV